MRLILAILFLPLALCAQTNTLTLGQSLSLGQVLSFTNAAGGGDTLTNGLWAWWKMDDGSGTTAADSSTNGRTLSLVNTPVWTNGAVGTGAIYFSATPSQSYGLYGTVSNPVPYSFSGWFKSGENVMALYDTFPAVASTVYARVGSSVGPKVFLGANNSRTWSLTSPTSVTNGAWHHIVFLVYGLAQTDITNARCYIDGTLQDVASTDSSGAANATRNRVELARQGFTGFMDDVRFYDRIITEAEITQLYQLGTP